MADDGPGEENTSKAQQNAREEREEQQSGYSKKLFSVLEHGQPLDGSLLPAYWPPPHPSTHSALIKYSFSKTSTYITDTTSASLRWPHRSEQRVTTTSGANNHLHCKPRVSKRCWSQIRWYSRAAANELGFEIHHRTANYDKKVRRRLRLEKRVFYLL